MKVLSAGETEALFPLADGPISELLVDDEFCADIANGNTITRAATMLSFRDVIPCS
jgi:hypothetical protein